jgi:hypothetical protein
VIYDFFSVLQLFALRQVEDAQAEPSLCVIAQTCFPSADVVQQLASSQQAAESLQHAASAVLQHAASLTQQLFAALSQEWPPAISGIAENENATSIAMKRIERRRMKSSVMSFV